MVYYNGEKVGSTIRQLRTQKGFSQSALSVRSGLTRPHISMIERGLKYITIETAIKIANGLEIDPKDLFNLIVDNMK